MLPKVEKSQYSKDDKAYSLIASSHLKKKSSSVNISNYIKPKIEESQLIKDEKGGKIIVSNKNNQLKSRDRSKSSLTNLQHSKVKRTTTEAK